MKIPRSIFIATIAVLALASALLVGCSGRVKKVESESIFDTARSKRPSAAKVRGLDAKAALSVANEWGPGEKGVTSFVDQRKVGFTFSGGDAVEIPLPESQMVIAIAPYINRTHTCEIHYMSGCQGELVDVPVKVHGATADGTVVVDGTFTTMDNGFIELWLPRGLTINLTLEAKGKSVAGVIETNEDSNTCITTLRLM